MSSGPSPAPTAPRVLPLLRRVSAVALLVLAACGGGRSGSGADEVASDTVSGVGSLPEGRDRSLTLPPLGTLPSGAAVPVPDATVGERALGNRLVLIGDSILAGTAPRYGGEACDTLVPLGWQVEVEAEVGRFIDFGNRVLDVRPPEMWDAAVVFLGTNYGGNEALYAAELDEILDRLAPRPVVIVTVTNHSPLQREVNEVIELEVGARDNVDVFDWTTASGYPGVLSGDGIHPTDAGRQLLIDGLASLLGRAPDIADMVPRCLSSELTDDSLGRGGSSIPGISSTTPSTPGGAVTSTSTPPTTNVAAPTTTPPTVPTTPVTATTVAPIVTTTQAPVTVTTTAPPTTAVSVPTTSPAPVSP